MPFTAAPMVPGDLYDSANRLAAAGEAEFARIVEPAQRAAWLDRLWGEVTELGWPAVAIPEAAGGAGGTLRDLAALLEGGARSALALPLGAAFGVAPALLAATEDTALLAGIAEGRERLAAAFATLHGSGAGSRFTARWDGAAPVLDGALLGIEAPPAATGVLLACEIGGEPVLLHLPATGAERHERLDNRPTLDLRFPGATPRLLARGPAVAAAAARAMRIGALLAGVEAVGAMGALLEQTIGYLAQRVQFDAPLATQQVLRHKVAELYAAQEQARGLVLGLLDRVAAGEWPERELDLAKLHLGPASRRFAAGTIQLHGGMGMTEELPASRLAKRLLMLEFEYGDTSFHEARLLKAG